MQAMPQRILFRLTQDHLLVANTGKPFGERSLIAVCNSDSDKDANDPLEIVESGAPDPGRWVSAIVERTRAAFEVKPELLRRLRRSEKQTKDDYKDRVLLELLQNAIDAGRDSPIGNKGRGFRALLNIADEIEVHSGELHVRWSDADARNALGALAELANRLPVLDLPGFIQPSEVKSIPPVGHTDRYNTVIRLKLTDFGRAHILEEWRKFASDPSLLLFIDGDIEIRWEREESRCTWKRNQDCEIVSVSVEDAAQPYRQLRWCSFASGHARAAYSINEGGRFQPSGVSEPRLRSYFPANLSPHPFANLFLHHGKFELQTNREYIEPNDKHLGELAHAMLNAAQSVKDQGELLDLFEVGSLNDKDESRIEYKVWEAAKTALSDAVLPILGGRRLADIKTCPKADVLPYEWRGENRLKNWSAFLTALKQERPAGLNDLPVLKPGVEIAQREATLLKFHPTCSFTSDQLRTLEWAPVEMSPEPVSSFTFKVFLPHKGEPFDSPSGFEVRFLSKAFLDACGTGLESFMTEALGVLKFCALSVVEHAVLPALTANQTFEQRSDLIHFLSRLRDADQAESKKPVESFNWHDSVRRELIQKLHIRCQGRSWTVLQIYAGEKWTGNRFLEGTFSDQRGFLDVDPHADQEQRELEENFWKWLGVAWCPKVLPVLEAIVVEKQHGEGLTWVNGRFQGQFFQMPHAPEGWSEYCRALRCDVRFTGWSYFPRLKANWTIDGGTSALAQVGAFGVIAKHWPAYRGWLRGKIGYSTNAQIDHDNRSNGELSSHLAWLFQTAKWVPCANGLQCGCNAFQPSGSVAQELKAFALRLDLRENDTGDTQIHLPPDFLNACGIRNGWKEVNDDDWSLWLDKASEMQPNGSSDRLKRDAIRGLYRALLNHRKRKTGDRQNEEDAAPLDRVALWSIERGDEAHEIWRLLAPNEAQLFFVDRPDVADVNLPGLRTFPVRLDGLAGKARQHLDLRPLSEALSGEPTEEGREKLEFSNVTSDRLHELMAYLQLDGSQRDDAELRMTLESVTLRESNRLKVQFSVYDKPTGEPLLRSKFHKFDKETGRWTVFVNHNCCDDERWEAFAEALLLSSGQDTNNALNARELLRCKAEVLPERMIKLGVAPETAEALRNKRDEHVKQPTSLPAQPSTKEGTTTEAPQVPEQKPAVPPAIRPPSENGPTLTKGTPGSNDRSSGSSSERRPRSPTDGQRSPSSRPHPEQGLKAQRWLFERVKEWCEQQQLPGPVEELDDVDITILLSPPFLIEAKRIDGSTIHWTRNQIETAKANPGRYVVALLRPNEVGDGNEVFWVQEPLNDFLALQRHVEWTWQPHKGGIFPDDSWSEPDNKPSKPANSFNAEITVDDPWLGDLPTGIEQLAQMLSVVPKP